MIVLKLLFIVLCASLIAYAVLAATWIIFVKVVQATM